MVMVLWISLLQMEPLTHGELIVFPNNTTAAGSDIVIGSRLEFESKLFPFGLSAGDINGDGKIDIAMGILEAGETNIDLFFNSSSAEGSFTFEKQSLDMGLVNNRNLEIGDLNMDGKPDIAAVSKSSFGTLSEISIADNSWLFDSYHKSCNLNLLYGC